MDAPPPAGSPPSNYPRPNLADDRIVLREIATSQNAILMFVPCVSLVKVCWSS